MSSYCRYERKTGSMNRCTFMGHKKVSIYDTIDLPEKDYDVVAFCGRCDAKLIDSDPRVRKDRILGRRIAKFKFERLMLKYKQSEKRTGREVTI